MPQYRKPAPPAPKVHDYYDDYVPGPIKTRLVSSDWSVTWRYSVYSLADVTRMNFYRWGRGRPCGRNKDYIEQLRNEEYARLGTGETFQVDMKCGVAHNTRHIGPCLVIAPTIKGVKYWLAELDRRSETRDKIGKSDRTYNIASCLDLLRGAADLRI